MSKPRLSDQFNALSLVEGKNDYNYALPIYRDRFSTTSVYMPQSFPTPYSPSANIHMSQSSSTSYSPSNVYVPQSSSALSSSSSLPPPPTSYSSPSSTQLIKTEVKRRTPPVMATEIPDPSSSTPDPQPPKISPIPLDQLVAFATYLEQNGVSVGEPIYVRSSDDQKSFSLGGLQIKEKKRDGARLTFKNSIETIVSDIKELTKKERKLREAEYAYIFYRQRYQVLFLFSFISYLLVAINGEL